MTYSNDIQIRKYVKGNGFMRILDLNMVRNF